LSSSRKPLRIALLGTRGIPANYGGFETFAEEISVRLVKRGHQVTVYCRGDGTDTDFRGVHLRHLPTIRHKYLDTIAHTGLSTLDLFLHRQDVVLYCNAANAVFTLWPRLAGMPTALNVDGVERRRKKWNIAAKAWYLASEWMSTWCCSSVITDAEKIREYFLERYGKDSTFIPYGAETGKVPGTEALSALGLEPGRYVLYVSRMEPENNALMVRQAFERVRTDFKLALIGDAPYAAEYIRQVKDTSDPRIVIPGAIYGTAYQQLQSNCAAYIQATEVGGTHPALIESMGRGCMVLYLDTLENVEVAADAGIVFADADELVQKLQDAVDAPLEERLDWGQRAMSRVQKLYSWNAVTDRYESLLQDLVSGR
jgi:glycosyltransferase involved in cell wall biosynthesis